MDFYRGEAYNEWFKYLDSTGNFYYERWGDGLLHSMGLALFADTKDIHWFRDIGYYHDPYVNCPNSPDTIGCEAGQFSRWDHLADQNCMASWIDYSLWKTQVQFIKQNPNYGIEVGYNYRICPSLTPEDICICMFIYS